MTGREFEAWMLKNRIKMSFVSEDTGLHSNTIYAFRRGEYVNDSTKKTLLDFKARYDSKKARTAVATG